MIQKALIYNALKGIPPKPGGTHTGDSPVPPPVSGNSTFLFLFERSTVYSGQ